MSARAFARGETGRGMAAKGPGCVKTITLKKCTKCNSSKRSRPPRCQHHQSQRRRNRIKFLLVSRKASEFSHSLGQPRKCSEGAKRVRSTFRKLPHFCAAANGSSCQ